MRRPTAWGMRPVSLDDAPLFRPEAVLARGQRQLGTIVLANRPASWALAGAVACLVIALLVLLWYGQYTRRTAVSGYLIPGAGVQRVHSPMAGRVVDLHVEEGQLVAAGAALVTVADERIGADGAGARAAMSRQIERRVASLRRSMAEQTALFGQLREGLQQRIATLVQERDQLEGEIATQRARLRYAEATRGRYLALSAQGFVSAGAEQERAEAVLDQQARLQAMARGRTALQRELLGLRAELAGLPMRERTALAELDRARAEAAQEGIENQARAAVVVVAGQAGRVSGLAVARGQAVGPDRPLLSLVPEGAPLEAHLFAPSRAIGFVRPGQAVALRYSAFPYQKFGHHRGVITEVSRTPLGPAELDYPLAAHAGAAAPAAAQTLPAAPNEPLYRIKARLERQTASAYGQPQPLQPGLQLDADLLLDRRTLFEWIFEAAYSLRGRYAP